MLGKELIAEGMGIYTSPTRGRVPVNEEIKQTGQDWRSIFSLRVKSRGLPQGEVLQRKLASGYLKHPFKITDNLVVSCWLFSKTMTSTAILPTFLKHLYQPMPELSPPTYLIDQGSSFMLVQQLLKVVQRVLVVPFNTPLQILGNKNNISVVCDQAVREVPAMPEIPCGSCLFCFQCEMVWC